ncbi:uncharacterized protein LOC132736818 [Ruditapes philippinarum]|uniref:uncharacterized protein LOC132736818 n=1 Tax=Ruditapes philippinarum TaxID=129788 RepID=UPI00295A8A6D|nr:uncharacterized protein LOC132736818 [Ruditapes philippinarum]
MAHEIHIKNNKYRQWVKAGLGLGYLKEGLAPFCDGIGRQQHKDIINQIQQTKTPQPNITCGACQITTLQPDHVRVSKGICPLKQDKCNCCFPNNKGPCPNNICGAIYDSIIQYHASIPPAPFWKNSDVQQWSTDPWSVIKCFINVPGYKDKTSAVDTDCIGLLHVIINNKYFHSHIGCNVTGPNNLFSKVRQYRNEIFHSSSMELEESKANCYIDDMIAVLQDGKELLHRQDAQQAVVKLQDLKKKKFIITTENVNGIMTQIKKNAEEWQKEMIASYCKTLLKVPAMPLLPRGQKCNFSEIYVRPTITREIKGEKGETKEIEVKSMSDIFIKNDVPLKHIYVLGDAGSGKSSFCKYLVNCWCIAHSDAQNVEDEFEGVKEMNKFDFMFYISLRHNQDIDSVQDMIKNQYDIDISSPVFKKDSAKIIILLDGLDEWSSERKSYNQFQTMGLPKQDVNKDYTIVTTSRPWKVHTLGISETEIEQILNLKGFDLRCEREMVDRTVSQLNFSRHASKDARVCEQKLREKSLESLKQLPIMLQQLICLWFDGKLDKTSKCAIYTGMLELFFTWNDMKTAGTSTRLMEGAQKVYLPKTLADKKIFKLNSHLIYYVSKLAYETLFNCPKDKSLTFDISMFDELEISDEVRENCLKLGIMTEDECPSLSVSEPPSSLFSFIHKSMQEFLAAVNICINFNAKNGLSDSTGNVELVKKFINEVFQKCSTVNDILEQSNVIIMLCGLEPRLATHVSKYIYDTVSEDSRVEEYRSDIYKDHRCITDIQKLLLESMEEFNASCSIGNNPVFHIGDLVIERRGQSRDIVCSGIDQHQIVPDTVLSIYVDGINTANVEFTKYLPIFHHLEKIVIRYEYEYEYESDTSSTHSTQRNTSSTQSTQMDTSSTQSTQMDTSSTQSTQMDTSSTQSTQMDTSSTQMDTRSTQSDTSSTQSNEQLIDEIHNCICETIKVNTLTLKSLSLHVSYNDKYYPVCKTVVSNLPSMINLVAIRMSGITMSHGDTTTFYNFLERTSHLEQIHLVNVECECENQHDVNLSKHQQLQYLHLVYTVSVIDVDTTNLEILSLYYLKNSNYGKIFDSIRKSYKLKELELHGDIYNKSQLYHNNITNRLVTVLPLLHNLRKLVLWGCSLTDNIIQSPLEMKSLKNITLGEVKMSLTTWRKFVDSLPHVPHTVDVSVRGCDITEDGKEFTDGMFTFQGLRGEKGNDAKLYVKDQDELFHVKCDGYYEFGFSTKKLI